MPVPCFEGIAEKLSQTGVSSTGLLEPLQPGRGTPEQNRVDSGHGGGGWLWTGTPRTHAPPTLGIGPAEPQAQGWAGPVAFHRHRPPHRAAMFPQEPVASLRPLMTAGTPPGCPRKHHPRVPHLCDVLGDEGTQGPGTASHSSTGGDSIPHPALHQCLHHAWLSPACFPMAPLLPPPKRC